MEVTCIKNLGKITPAWNIWKVLTVMEGRQSRNSEEVGGLKLLLIQYMVGSIEGVQKIIFGYN